MELKYNNAFEQYLKRSTVNVVVPKSDSGYKHNLYLAWCNGYSKGFDKQEAQSTNMIRRWTIERKIEDTVEALVYDIKGQMLCRGQEFIEEMMEKLGE